MNTHNKSLVVILLMMTLPTAILLVSTDVISKDTPAPQVKPEEFSSQIQNSCDRARYDREIMEYALEQAPTNPTLNKTYGQLLINEKYKCAPVPEKWSI